MRITGYAGDRLDLGTEDGRGAVILAEVGERELSDKDHHSQLCAVTVRDRSCGGHLKTRSPASR